MAASAVKLREMQFPLQLPVRAEAEREEEKSGLGNHSFVQSGLRERDLHASRYF